MCNKLSTLRSGLCQLSVTPHIIIFTETWLKPFIHSSELGLVRYDIFRDDREPNGSTRGGGVLIAVHHDLRARELQVTRQCNAVFIEFKYCDKLLVIAAAYMPPTSSTDIFAEFSKCLEDISSRNDGYEFIVCGDFNLPYIKWTNEPLSFEPLEYIPPTQRDNANRLCQTLSFLGLYQLHSAHRQKGYSLDLLFAPSDLVPSMAINENLIPVDQHHESGFFKIHVSSDRHNVNFKSKYNYVKGDYPNIVQALQSEDWERMFSDVDIETCLNRFYNTLNIIIEKFVPKATMRPQSFPAWFTHELRSLICNKKAAHAQWKGTRVTYQF